MMTCLVTGGNGFLGRAMLNHLVGMGGFRVFALTRSNVSIRVEGVTYLKPIDLSVEEIDCTLLVNIDVVIHTAARVHVIKEISKNPLNDFRSINVDGTILLARACARSGVKRFIYLSSIGVNGAETLLGEEFSEESNPRPHNDYALSKYEAEIGLQKISVETGLEVVIVRPPLVYGVNAPGNFSSLLRLFRSGIPLPLNGIKNKRSFISLENLLDFLSLCTTHPRAANEVFLVSDGRQLSTADFFKELSLASKVSIQTFYVPAWLLVLGLNIFGIRKRFIGVHGNLRINITKAQNYLGWTPPFSFEYCIKHVIDDLNKKIESEAKKID